MSRRVTVNTRLPSLDVILAEMVVLVLSLSFHEAAHAWAANRLGDPTARQLGRLTLNPLAHIDWIGTILFPFLAMYSHLPIIGWAKPVPVSFARLRHPRRDFAMVALAGPVSNLVLATGAAILLLFVPGGRTVLPMGGGIGGVLAEVVALNVLLAVFNMFPFPPLDGGNVLAGVVPEPVARLIDQLRPFGFLIIYALMLTGVLWAVMGPIGNAIFHVLRPVV